LGWFERVEHLLCELGLGTDAANEQTVQNAATGGAPPLVGAVQPPQPEPAKRSPAHYQWAALIACIYEVFPLAGGNDIEAVTQK
jgi:hypothetical protein